MTCNLEDEQDFETEEQEELISKDVYKRLKQEKQYNKYLQQEQKEKEKLQHKAKFTRKNNENCYICDNCGKIYPEQDGVLMYRKQDSRYGEFAYCDDCLKKLYPNYKKVKLFGMIKKTDYRDNHCDLQYSKGFR